MQRQTLKLEELRKQGKVMTSQNLHGADGTEVSYLEQGDSAMCVLGPRGAYGARRR